MSSAFAQGVTTDPVGYVTTTITGASGSAAFSSVSTPLHSGNVAVGAISSASGAVITLTGSPLEADDQLVSTDVNGSNLYYLLVTEVGSTSEGLLLDVTDNTTNTITVDYSGDLSSVLTAADSIVVREYNTVASIFGAANEAGLTSGQADTSSDIVYLMENGGTGTFTRYYYQTDAFGGLFGGDGWRLVGDINTDIGNTRVAPDGAVLVKRITAGDVSFVTAGTVSEDDVLTPLQTGINLVATTYPVDSTLFSLGLYVNGNDRGVVSGQDDQSSDLVYVLQSSGTYNRYYYQTDVFPGLFGGDGWRAVGNINDDAGAVSIPIGSAVLVKHIGSGNNWESSAPYSFTSN